MCCVRLPVWTISAAADITNPLLTPLDPPPRACGRLIGTHNTRMQYQILFRPRQTRRSPANGATRDVARRRWLRSLRFTRAGSARGRRLLLLLLQIALLCSPHQRRRHPTLPVLSSPCCNVDSTTWCSSSSSSKRARRGGGVAVIAVVDETRFSWSSCTRHRALPVLPARSRFPPVSSTIAGLRAGPCRADETVMDLNDRSRCEMLVPERFYMHADRPQFSR